MELFTMNSRYDILSEIDYFSSAIWTERNLGDGDFQINVPAQPDIIKLLWYGTRIGLVGSKEVMMVDKLTIKDGVLTVIGTSLEQQLNNRFIRFTPVHSDTSYSLVDTPGGILQYLVQNFAINGKWLNGINDMGFPNPEILKIPDFTIGSYDNSMDAVVMGIPYGPLYDALKNIAQTFNLCQKIERFGVGDIRYTNWIGIDHTSKSGNALVRLSPKDDNFDGTIEIIDGSKFKTHAWAFSTQFTGSSDFAGSDSVEGPYSGFDLRAELVLASDVPVDIAYSQDVLNQRAYDALAASRITSAVDGQIRPNSQYQFGKHYNLGDIVEVQGSSGLLSSSRVTEYIRAQDATGEKAYPTLVSVDTVNPQPAVI